MRLVLDTNVWIAALISHGVCSELVEHCAINHVVILSPFILDELKYGLERKFGYSATESESVVRVLTDRFTMVSPEPLPAAICRDPDDDGIIATAIAGNCLCVVTGDQDLLDLKRTGGIDMVAPSRFWSYEGEVRTEHQGD